MHHGAEKGLLRASWSPDGESVTCGSADRIVHIWDASSGNKMVEIFQIRTNFDPLSLSVACVYIFL